MASAAGRHTELRKLVVVHVVLQSQDCLLLDLECQPHLFSMKKMSIEQQFLNDSVDKSSIALAYKV